MKISYIRHGESEANILKVLSSKIEEPYKLTENGINQIKTATVSIFQKLSAVLEVSTSRRFVVEKMLRL